MSTRQNSQPLLAFEDNPESIVRAANAAKRTAAHLATPPPLPPAIEPPIFLTPPQFHITPFHPPGSPPSPFLPRSSANQPVMANQPMDNKPDYLRMLMEAQHNQLLQAQQDCAAAAERMTRFEEASAHCIAQLEKAILHMSTKSQCLTEPRQANPTSSLDQINLQRFCTADGPIFSGPFHEVGQFLNWINAVQIFFASKGVFHDTDKICIIGSLIRKRNLSRRQARWTELLADFDLQFDYIRGKDNSVANALSHKDIPDDPIVTADNIACVAALSKFKSVISEALKSQIILGYDVDPFCISLKPSLPLREDCNIIDNLIVIDDGTRREFVCVFVRGLSEDQGSYYIPDWKDGYA
ncbi:hypothetical protein PCANC_22816 [Puccinia coronata f. sp. avenae]|uniref:Reverse transcriptase RNase H-like domain-containing protein n=1 Tax=Puccinia coronata f. sp. avenae TaxID=200324 RepID=A0A2N5UCT7_9BASI|nr:hypothetical protein PCANC_22816 [Puccinia coronata f. sp. avenae]